MAYKSFYRKYRPTSFSEVVGQKSIIKTLLNSIKLNKISHAYIFSGTRGTGKTTIAKNFARAINCLNLKDGIPCNECEICATKNTDEIQDIIEIDAASNNGVDEIRELKSKVNLVPTLCKYKVYIIDEVHMLSTGAFNALLKTLEEPPSHVVFILATTEIQKIPSTILSRCQRFDFKKLSQDDIKERLKYICDEEKIKIDTEALEEISRISDGSLRDAISFLDQASLYTDNNIDAQSVYEIIGTVSGKSLMSFVENIIDNDTESALNFFDELYNKGKDFYRFSEDLMFFLRNILLSINAPKYYEKKNFLNKEYVEKIKPKIKEKDLNNIIRELNFLISDIKKSSNPNILFELFVFKIIQINDVEPEKETKKVVERENKEIKKDENDIKFDVVESEFGNEIKLNIVNEHVDELQEYKKILINNTIAQADKERLKEVKEIWSKIQSYLIDDTYKESARILLDSKLNAVGNNYILLTYKYDCMVIEHDRNKKKINELIDKITESKNKIVAITEEKWNELRPYYIELKKKNKKIELLKEIEENNIEEPEKNNDSNPIIEEAINVFGEELVEMEG